MSILKLEDRTPRSLYEMQNYLIDSDKTDCDGIFGIGVHPQYAAEEMELVQQLFYKTNLTHPYVQRIFAFDVGIDLPILLLRNICMEVGYALLVDHRQVLGAIHYKETNKVHCHYMINYIDIEGNLYRQTYSIYTYKILVNQVLARYGLNPIHFYCEEQNDLLAV